MPAIVAWLLGVLESRIGSIVISALLALGLSWTTYTFSVAPLRAYILSQTAGIPAMGIGVLGFLGVDRAITMILSAVASKAAVNGAKSILTRKASS
ncbi:DUF2523 family protein [Dyella soli]|uniref:DUF2523 domain-containing protein n=1 Tax=Dyella soli TaxID=522319 RepID=A0A4V6N9Z4_9GAMM|nr:DUF2523 family protein [Dyella soli]TCI10131.1 DUF2523 domain-containing protein [Dyella soli]